MAETHRDGPGQSELALLLALKIGFGVGTPADVEQLRVLKLSVETPAR